MTRLPDPPSALVVDAWFDGQALHGPSTLQWAAGHLVRVDPGDHGDALAARGQAVERQAFVLPGLVDAHVHLFLHGHPVDAASRSAHLRQDVDALTAAARANAARTLRCGVTQVRDAGDRHGINHRIRAAAAAAGSGLAQVRSAGLGLKRARRYGSFMATDVDEDDRIRETVAALAQHSDEIKLILTGIIDFDAGAVTDEPQFDAASATQVVIAAHAAGRRVMAHCSGAKGLAVAVAAGVDSIEHGFFMTDGLLAQLRDRQLAWTPTFSPVQFQWAQPQVAGWSAQTVGRLRRILDDHADQLLLAHRLGVPLLAGTDAGSMGVDHGTALVDELRCFVDAGLPLAAALAAATSVPRRHFGAAQPLLAPGAAFDAVALAASPWEDFDALRRPLRVWQQGVAVDLGAPPPACQD